MPWQCGASEACARLQRANCSERRYKTNSEPAAHWLLGAWKPTCRDGGCSGLAADLNGFRLISLTSHPSAGFQGSRESRSRRHCFAERRRRPQAPELVHAVLYDGKKMAQLPLVQALSCYNVQAHRRVLELAWVVLIFILKQLLHTIFPLPGFCSS